MKKTKVRLTVGKGYANYFLSITITFQEKKSGKSGPEKYFYFLLPNNRSIKVSAQYSATCGK